MRSVTGRSLGRGDMDDFILDQHIAEDHRMVVAERFIAVSRYESRTCPVLSLDSVRTSLYRAKRI